jgi:hypothetical protein
MYRDGYRSSSPLGNWNRRPYAQQHAHLTITDVTCDADESTRITQAVFFLDKNECNNELGKKRAVIECKRRNVYKPEYAEM